MATAVMVPNFNIFGHHHHKTPYKDKAGLMQEDIENHNHRWLGSAPAIRSRSELQQARKAARIPDKSYDFDGDGVVGQADYFVGRSFDRNCDGRLSDSERREAEQAIKNGFLDRYMRGLDSTGDVGRRARGTGEGIRQTQGVILTGENQPQFALKDRYGPHFNAHKVPRRSTRTALLLERATELKNAAAAVGDRLARQNAAVREPQPPTAETEPRVCPIAHVRERAEADRQANRMRAGLLPVDAPCNPERELRTVGADFVEKPLIATRSQLLETRKELMKHDCEELRAKGDELFPDRDLLKSQQEAIEFDFRRPHAPPEGPEPKTLSKLKDDRRTAKIEYDLANFGHPDVYPREYPRFSDRPDEPFWSSGAANSSSSGKKPQSAPAGMCRIASEPVLKATDVCWRDFEEEHSGASKVVARAAGLAAPRGPSSEPLESELGTKTVKRWTADMLEHGKGLNKPRFFDSIKPPHIGPRDLEELDVTSGLEPIRREALRRQAELRKQNAENPRHSVLHRNAEFGEPSVDSFTFQQDRSRARQPSNRTRGTSGQGGALAENKSTLRSPRRLTDRLPRPRSETGVRSGGFQLVSQQLEAHGRPEQHGRAAAANSASARMQSAPA